jgi:hypothetical protein
MEHISKILPSFMLDVAAVDNEKRWKELMKQFKPGLHVLNGNAKELALNLIVKFGQAGNRTLVFDQEHGYNQVLNKQLLSAYSGWSNRALQNNQISFGADEVKQVLDSYSNLPIFITDGSDDPMLDIFEQHMLGEEIDAIFILSVSAFELDQGRYQLVSEFLKIPIIILALEEEAQSESLLGRYYNYKSVTFVEEVNYSEKVRIVHTEKDWGIKTFIGQKVFAESLKYRLK